MAKLPDRLGGYGWMIVSPRLPGGEQRLLAQLTEMLQRIAQYRQADAPPEQWALLEVEAERVISDSARQFRQVGSSRPDLFELNWAAQLLPEAVREGRLARPWRK